MFIEPVQGGGNISPNPRIIVRRSSAVGDAIAASCVADRLFEKGYECEFQTHSGIHCLLRHQPSITQLSQPTGYAHVDLDRCYETDPNRRNLHFSEMFMAKAEHHLKPYGIPLGPALNCRPRIRLPNEMIQIALAKFNEHPRPWIFIVPRSNSYAVRQVPDSIWESFAAATSGTKFWLGTHPAPKGIRDLQCRHLDDVIAWISAADLVVSVDTGPLHIAAALGKQIVALGQSSSPELHLSDQVDFETLWPLGNLDCLNCQQNICHKDRYIPPCQSFDPEQIAELVQRKVLSTKISCVIPIFRPDAQMLNHCLDCVLPQVSEVVITREAAGIVPHGTREHSKIRHVVHRSSGIGFGRNVNFGVRHTCNPFVLILNDDVYLRPDAVDRLSDEMGHGHVGVVGQLLYYPNGTIYHAGKPRATDGGIGFPHIDLGKHLPTITEPVEMENTNGASILVRREAFYDIGGFDERFMFYAEDDDLAMRMRLHGWKVYFTPLAVGTHDEHGETKKLGSKMWDIMNQSNKLFGELWAPYFSHNRNNRGLGNFDYLKK